MSKRYKVAIVITLFLASQILITSNKSTKGLTGTADLEKGEFVSIFSFYILNKSHYINWEYDAENEYGVTVGIFVEVWAMAFDEFQTWDKTNTENINGYLLSKDISGSGNFRVKLEDLWYIILYNSDDSIYALNLNYDVNFYYNPTFLPYQIKLLIILPTILILGGLLIPLSIRWWKRSKPKRIIRKSKKEILIQDSIRETLEQIGSTTPVSLERLIDYTKKILRNKVKNDPSIKAVPAVTLSKNVFEENISLILAQNVDLGKYYEVEQVFVKASTESMDVTRKTIVCYFCGSPLSENETACPTCKKELQTCAVCKLPITFGESVGKCSLCENKAHITHMQEWVKAKGKCPSCLQEIPLEGIVIEDLQTGKHAEK